MGIEFLKNSSSSQFYHRPSGSSDHSCKTLEMLLRSHFHRWTFAFILVDEYDHLYIKEGPMTNDWLIKHTNSIQNIFNSRHFRKKLVKTSPVVFAAIILKREKFHVVEKDIFIARTNIFFPVGANLFCEARKEGEGEGG